MSEDLFYVGFNSHDCETIYKCPCCGEFYYSWNLLRRGIEIGDVFECDYCKETDVEVVFHLPTHDSL